MLTAFVCMAERDRDNVDCFVCMAERDRDNVDWVCVNGRKG